MPILRYKSVFISAVPLGFLTVSPPMFKPKGCVCVYAYAYIYTHVYICVYIHTYVCICMYIHIYICIGMYLYTHLYIYIYRYAYIWICICFYIYIYAYSTRYGVFQRLSGLWAALQVPLLLVHQLTQLSRYCKLYLVLEEKSVSQGYVSKVKVTQRGEAEWERSP